MPNLNDTRRDGSLQRLSLDNGIARANRAPLDPAASKWVDRDAWRSINAQVRQWKADVDAYAWALPISQQDEPEPQTFTDTETGETRENPEWRCWKDATDTVANATADTVALYEARQGAPETRTGPDGETEEYTPDRQMVIEWPDSEPGDGEVYAVSASVTDQREAKIAVTVADGDATRLQQEADALKPAAAARIDAEANARRNALITEGDGQVMSYLDKARQARIVKDGGTDTPIIDALVGVETQADGTPADTREKVADVVLATQGDWAGYESGVDPKRRGAKIAIRNAATPQDVEAATEVSW